MDPRIMELLRRCWEWIGEDDCECQSYDEDEEDVCNRCALRADIERAMYGEPKEESDDGE
jgi:hypothetical protein